MKHGPVRSGTTGQLIPCCFQECDKIGTSRYEYREPIRWATIGGNRMPIQHRIYLFCSERHRALWMYSHISNGNLPTGSKGMIT